MYDKTQIGQQLGIDISSLSHEITLISPELMELMRTLMSSTGNYICSRIEDDRHKKAYQHAMVQFIEITKECNTYSELNDKGAEIRTTVKKFIKPTWLSSRQREIKYYNIACNHATEILNSIVIRFVTGGYDSESRKHKYTKSIAVLRDLKIFNEDK
jgi:hypothetical protein